MVEEIRSGNEFGADPLYSAVSDCARAQLYQSVNPQAVDDHVQEVVMIVRAAILTGELRDPHCLMGFVRTVTRRQISGHIRRAVFHRKKFISVDSSAPPAAPWRESPEGQIAQKETALAGQHLLSRLSARDREILVRFDYAEQDCLQICREMQLTATQFRLYKSRALAKCDDLARRLGRSRFQSTRPLRIA